MTETSTRYGQFEIENTAIEPLEKWESPGACQIHLEHPEFTALCPRSGYPDSGIIVVDYIPDQWVVELKAFKLYVNSFRNRQISHEAVTIEIADRLMTEINPRSLRVIGDFMRRGGVKTVITVARGEGSDLGVYHPNLL